MSAISLPRKMPRGASNSPLCFAAIAAHLHRLESSAGYARRDTYSVRADYAEKKQSSDSNGTDVLK
jgi:hypothetical protein